MAQRCRPVCWVRADGGWALRVWEVWQVCRTADSMSGRWTVDGDLFRLAVPTAVLADDEERLEWLSAMQLCARTLNDKTDLLTPDDDDPE